MSSIPTNKVTLIDDWSKSKLIDQIIISHGWAFSGEFFSDLGPVLLTPGNFKRSGGLYFNEKNTKRYSGIYNPLLEFSNGDYVVVMTDLSSSCEILGNVGIIESSETILHNQRIGKITFKNKLLYPKFFYYFTQTPDFKRTVKNTATGTTVRHTSPTKLLAITIRLPPVSEQKAIAKILSTVDQKIDLIEQKITQTEQLKKGLMQKLFTQGVGTQDEHGQWQPHSELNETTQMPVNWQLDKLGSICEVKGGKRLPKGEKLQVEPTKQPYIRVSDMKSRGVNLESIQYLPKHLIDTLKNYTITTDDLFISVAGTIGIVGRIPSILNGANLTENADKLTNIQCNSDYLLHYMNFGAFQNDVCKAVTSNAQPKLALTRIKNFYIPIPPLAEQQQIAEILSTVDKKLDLLHEQKAETQQLKKGLMQKLLTGQWRVNIEQ